MTVSLTKKKRREDKKKKPIGVPHIKTALLFVSEFLLSECFCLE